MNRRGFFGKLGSAGIAVVASGVTASGTEPDRPNPDDFLAHGFRVKWRDYLPQPNQNVIVGMWHAKHETLDLQWVSTTRGGCYPSRDWEVVDLTGGLPILTIFATDEEKATLKQYALEQLVAMISRPALQQPRTDGVPAPTRDRSLMDQSLTW